MRSIASGAIDRIPAYIQSYAVRSVTASCQLCVRLIVGVTFGRISASAPHTFNRRSCVRLHCIQSYNIRSIADNCLRIPMMQESKRWIIGPAKAMRETQVYVVVLDRDPYARAQCARSHSQWSRLQSLLNFSPLCHKLHQ